jgi:hypothetical protein
LKAAADKERSKNNSDGVRGLGRSNIHEALKLLPSNCQIEDLALSGGELFWVRSFFTKRFVYREDDSLVSATKSDKTSKKAPSLFLASSLTLFSGKRRKMCSGLSLHFNT